MQYIVSRMERACQFCKNLATYAPLDEMEKHNIKVFFCHPCQAEYLYFSRQGTPSMKPSSVSLYATVNRKLYRWTIGADNHGHLWLVRKPGIPGEKINEDMEAVLHVPQTESLSVTPENIVAKVQAWLPFL